MQEWNENKELDSGFFYGVELSTLKKTDKENEFEVRSKDVDTFLKVDDQFLNKKGDVLNLDDVAVFDNVLSYEGYRDIKKSIQAAIRCLGEIKNISLRPSIDYLEHVLDVMEKGKLEL